MVLLSLSFSEEGKQEFMKKWLTCILIGGLLCIGLLACEKKENSIQEEDQGEQLITVGFSQLGAESDWRSANTKSMKEAFSDENGYNLIFEDGQQKQSNQIMAIRTFIQQEVDYIVLAPVTETGWDTVLQEAKEAGIPVILVDRMVDTENEDLFTCFVGSDFELEGKKATAWLHDYLEKRGIAPDQVNVVNIQGNLGATAQIGRSKGMKHAAIEYGWNLLDQMPGDFTQTKGKEVMEYFLKKYPELNVVYCENDNEAFGAIEAIEATGKKVGTDIQNGEIMVLSFDGVNSEALQYVIDQKIACIGECNPLHGPRVSDIIQSLECGIQPPKISFVSEEIYVHDQTVKSVTVDGKEYYVTTMTEEVAGKKAEQFGN